MKCNTLKTLALESYLHCLNVMMVKPQFCNRTRSCAVLKVLMSVQPLEAATSQDNTETGPWIYWCKITNLPWMQSFRRTMLNHSYIVKPHLIAEGNDLYLCSLICLLIFIVSIRLNVLRLFGLFWPPGQYLLFVCILCLCMNLCTSPSRGRMQHRSRESVQGHLERQRKGQWLERFF